MGDNPKTYDELELEAFLADEQSVEKMAAITLLTSPEDEQYVAIQLTSNFDASLKSEFDTAREHSLLSYMADTYFALEGVLDETVAHIIENKDVAPIDEETLSNTSSAFQELVLRAKDAERTQGKEFSNKVMMFAVGLAHYEWKDRQRPSVAYDEDIHGTIRLASDDGGEAPSFFIDQNNDDFDPS